MKNQAEVRLPFWIAILLVVFSFSSHNLLGQAREGSEMKLTLSEPLKGNLKESFIAGNDDKSIFLFNGYYREGDIHILDATTLKVRAVVDQSVLTDKPYRDRGFYYPLSYLTIQGNLYIFSNYYDWHANKLTVFGSILDSNGKLLVKDKEMFSIYKKTFNPPTVINYNLDGLNNIIVYAKSPIHTIGFSNKIGEELQVVVFNKGLEKLSGVTVNNSDIFKEKNGNALGPIYVNKDNISMIYLFKEDAKSKKVKSIMTLYAYNSKGKLEFSQELNTPDIGIEYYKVSDYNNKLRFTLYYSNGGFERINGTIIYDYNPTTKRFAQVNKNVYSDELKSNFISAKDVRKGLGIKTFTFFTSVWDYQSKSTTMLNEFVELYYPFPSNEDNYETGENQLIEKYDSTGKLTNAFVLKTPNIKKGRSNTNRFGWNVGKSKFYVVSAPDYVDKKSRNSIKDFDASVEYGIYTCKVKNESFSPEWTQVQMPLSKEDKIIYLTPYSTSHKMGVVIRKDKDGLYRFGYFEIPKD